MMKILALILLLAGCAGPEFHTVDLLKEQKVEEHEAYGKKFMIATQGRYSTNAGVEMFKAGGNAIDAAAAISFVISVERPQSTGLGGGGFMLVKSPQSGVPLTVDFRERAPFLGHEKMFLDKFGNEVKGKSLNGIFAAGTPGLVAGVLEVHKRYGKLSLKKVMAPAIKLAREGFPVYGHLHRAIVLRAEVLKKYPASKKIYFNKQGRPLNVGETLVQADLARTLELISTKGRDGFYKGKVAKNILLEFKKRGGFLRKKDLHDYEVKYRSPIHGKYRGYDIYSMSPPSSGGIHVIQILNTIEGDDLKSLGPHHPKTIHLVSSAMQQAFADRARYLGDSDFVKVPISDLTSKAYAKKIRKKIVDGKARPFNEVYAGSFRGFESDDTTHFTVADIEGNIISSTQTINGLFGSGVVVPGTGIVLNNEMDDFSTKVGASNLFGAVGGVNNLVAPGKRPLSSMSPTIVLKDGRPILGVGTPSGTRILTCVAGTLINYLEHNLSLYDSIATTRYHHQWRPDEIRVGSRGFPKYVDGVLKSYGHKINYKDLGCKVQAVAFEDGELHGVSDPRGQGMALGQ